MMEVEENNNLTINEDGEAIFEPEDGIIKKDSFTEEQINLIKSLKSDSAKQIEKSFFFFEHLENIDFPNVTTIDISSFSSCGNLKFINLKSINTIEDFTFKFCENLNTITIPQIDKIGLHVFLKCENLAKIYTSNIEQCKKIYASLEEFQKEKVKKGELEIYYEDGIFRIEEIQTSVNIEPENNIITSEDVNYEIKCATEISSTSATMIDKHAFFELEHIKFINFPNVDIVGEYAFYKCNKLEHLNENTSLPKATIIKNNAFCYCINLQYADLPSANIIDDRAFYGCMNLTCIRSNNATTIGVSSFCYCSKLENIYLPNVTTIQECAFHSCNLSSLDFPNVTLIEKDAFYCCEDLIVISIPKIKEIGRFAFKGCEKLDYIYTSTIEQCRVIYEALEENMKNKVLSGQLKIHYENKIFDPTEIE